MLRILLHYLLPFVLPILAYAVYVYLTNTGTAGWLGRAPWIWLFGAGAALVAVSLVAWGLIEGADPGTTYIPPRFEGGRVVPGEFVEPDG